MKRFILPIIILAFGIYLLIFLSSMKKDQKRRKHHGFIRTVQTQTVKYDRIQPLIESMGRVYARERITITPEVSGIVIKDKFKMQKGVQFKKGQTLFSIDQRQAFNTLQTITSDLQNALALLLPELKTELPDAYTSWQYFFDALSAHSIPKLPDTQSQREKLLAMRFNIFKLYYTTHNQRLILDKHTIRAPFDGTIEESTIFPSSMVKAGVGVGTVTRTDEMEIELPLTQKDAPFVKKGIPAKIFINESKNEINGFVHRISNLLDENMQTVSVFIRIKNALSQGAKSGAYAKVLLEGDELEHAFSIPRKAIHNKNGVYIIQGKKLVEKKVEIAYLSIDHAYIVNGVEESDLLITEPLQDAIIGMAVQSEQQSAQLQKARHKSNNKQGKKPKAH